MIEKQMMLDTQTRIASGFEEEKTSQYELGRARKWDARRSEIEKENARIYRRLQTVRPCMDRQSWNRHASHHEEVVRRRSKLPFVLHADSEWDEIEEVRVAAQISLFSSRGHPHSLPCWQEDGLRTLERSHLLIEDGGSTPSDTAGRVDYRGGGGGGGRRRGRQQRRVQHGGGRARSTEMIELSRSGTGYYLTLGAAPLYCPYASTMSSFAASWFHFIRALSY